MLRFNLVNYDLFALRDVDEKELRKEYSRLRSVAMKRLSRLESAGLMKPAVVARWRKYFVTLDKAPDVRDVRGLVSSAYSFLTNERTTVKGARKHVLFVVDNFRRYGITWATAEDYKSIANFIDSAHNGAYGDSVGSPDVIRFLATFKKEPDFSKLEGRFRKWLHQEEKDGNLTKLLD